MIKWQHRLERFVDTNGAINDEIPVDYVSADAVVCLRIMITL